MTCATHHLFLGYCPPPMDLSAAVIFVVVSFSNNHACVAHLKNDHSMGVIVHPQDIPDFYILIFESTRCVHPVLQTAKCRIADHKSKSYAARGADIRPAKGSAFPTVRMFNGIRVIVPGRVFHIPCLSLQCDHGLIDFRRGRNRIGSTRNVCGSLRRTSPFSIHSQDFIITVDCPICFCADIPLLLRIFPTCVYH